MWTLEIPGLNRKRIARTTSICCSSIEWHSRSAGYFRKETPSMSKTLKTFARDESGATAIEYGLIAALVAVGLIAALTALGGSLQAIFSHVSTTLDSASASVRHCPWVSYWHC